MRFLTLLPVVLLAAPAAVSAPNFPLDFEGQACDARSGICSPASWTVYGDGTVIENNTNAYGRYQWNGSTKTFAADFTDALATTMKGLKDQGAPCVRGHWTTNDPAIGGDFWFCKA